MILVLLGPPGAGKGTQGERLAATLGVPKIATGDVLRAAVRESTPLGREAKAAMDRGDLVPDEVILGIMKEALAKPDAARGAVLDGVVRTVPQAEGLERVLAELGKRLDGVLLFEVPEEELVRRLSGRTVCERCQTPYTGREPGCTCEKCGGTLVRRKDDEPEAVRRRLKVYAEQTSPVIAWYQRNGAPVRMIDAVGSLEDVERRALQAIGHT
ncbi:MAG TPA: adenylate kinase [Gemmatimonadaceae bacterium]|nr:adenylate kinase [Gemmatimonadaceae bacterium]